MRNCFGDRYVGTGNLDDLDQAITYGDDVVAATPNSKVKQAVYTGLVFATERDTIREATHTTSSKLSRMHKKRLELHQSTTLTGQGFRQPGELLRRQIHADG